MIPKKIACFVEGQTEQIFVERLFKEIAGYKKISKISINTYKFQGPQANRTSNPLRLNTIKDAPFFVLLYDCSGDSQVASDIKKQHQSLTNSGYEKILGLRDLYREPLGKKEEIETGIREFLKPLQTIGIPISVTLAVMEIEAWFLAEYNYFAKIDNRLTPEFIGQQISNLNLKSIDVEQRPHPSKDLEKIYQLVGRTYNKSKEVTQEIVNNLDYEFLYLHLVKSVKQLKKFIDEIDSFLV